MAKRKKVDPKRLIQRMPTPSVEKMIGETFGRLTVIKYAGYKVLPNGGQYHYVLCKCSCGNEVIGNANHISNNKWRSCGCLRIDHPNRFKHGFAPLIGRRDKIYVTWQGIHKRCSESGRNDTTRKYAENKIKVCLGWSGEHGFENFKKDMGEPTARTLDRINNSSHYSCGHCIECVENGWAANCRWTDDVTQSNNRGDFNNWVTIDGVKMTYRQADRYLGFKVKTIQCRVKTLGWSEEKAISTPIKKNKK